MANLHNIARRIEEHGAASLRERAEAEAAASSQAMHMRVMLILVAKSAAE